MVDDEELLELVEMEVTEQLEEYGFNDCPIIRGSALKALEDPSSEWGDKILELMAQHVRPGVRYNLGIANGGARSEMAEFAVRMKERFPDAVHMWEGEIDATLSVYIGDGVLGGGIQILED